MSAEQPGLFERSKPRGRWRTAIVCASVFAAVSLAGYWADLQPQLEEIEASDTLLAKLKEDYVNKKKVAVNLDLYRQQAREIDSSFGEVLRMLPARIDPQFVEVMQAARAHGLRIDELRTEPNQAPREFYAEASGRLKVSGPFHDVGAFVSDVSAIAGIVTLQDVKVQATSVPGAISMDSTVRAYRYLDDEEIAAQRKARAARKGAKK